MPNVHIVTDSGAHFANTHFIAQNPVTMLSNRIDIGGKIYREGIDIQASEALKLIARQTVAPTITSPSVAEYLDIYTRISHQADAIISIHTSREIHASWHNAKAAAQQLSGHVEIAVIDSQTICAAQGMLVRLAARAIAEESDFDAMVRRVRGAVERIYAMYYVETLDFLLQNKIFSPPHTILGTMLGIKPFLTFEDGQLIAVEKVKTRAQAIERLCEFAVEFIDIEDVVILQNKAHMTEQARMLHDRLTEEFAGRAFPTTPYGATLASIIGADATGVVILEEEMDSYIDDV